MRAAELGKNRGAAAPSPCSCSVASCFAELALAVSSPLVPAGTPPAYPWAVVRAMAEDGGMVMWSWRESGRDRVDVGAAVESQSVDKSVGGRIKVYLWLCVLIYV